MAAASALALAACAPKKQDLPPPPPPPATSAPAPAPTPTQDAGVSSTIVPGSLADFINQAGSDRVRFAYDSYEIDDTAGGILSRQAQWLNQYNNVRITVEGHADERGTREYNLALGDRRATAVKNFLAAQGVSTARMGTISYGKERPEADGADEAAYAINRRGVTTIGN
ncbi:peptidoglycan-associated lipoprotein Pal [Polymorphobacter sp.]|uniref:peptidoglycan-associated lipoprotein Pal n=1 Tax=Polymorphobacter sp. TaxID=1909290 RepID=UPI003F711CDD